MSASRLCGLFILLCAAILPRLAQAAPPCAREMTEEAGASIAVLITNAEAAMALDHPECLLATLSGRGSIAR